MECRAGGHAGEVSGVCLPGPLITDKPSYTTLSSSTRLSPICRRIESSECVPRWISVWLTELTSTSLSWTWLCAFRPSWPRGDSVHHGFGLGYLGECVLFRALRRPMAGL